MIFISGIRLFIYDSNSLSSLIVPGQMKKISSRKRKYQSGLILKPFVSFSSKSSRYRLYLLDSGRTGSPWLYRVFVERVFC